MTKKTVSSIILLLVLTIITSLSVQADNHLMGKFQFKPHKQLYQQDTQYIPLNKVADSIGVELNWHLNNNQVNGQFSHMNFSCTNFIIFQGDLYIPLNFFQNFFGLLIEVHGNNYFIYRHQSELSNLNLKLQTNKTIFKKGEPIAISLLLLNNTKRTVNLKYSSSQRYDLVLKRFGREIWRYSENKGFIAAISYESLDPSDYLLYTKIINPYEEKYIPWGDYQLQAEIKTIEGQITSQPINITIK